MKKLLCPNCKAKNPKSASFCFNCGCKMINDKRSEILTEPVIVEPVNTPEPSIVIASAPTIENEKNFKRKSKPFWMKYLYVIIPAVLIIVSIVTIVIGRVVVSSEIGSAVDNYVEAVYLGDTEKIEYLIPEKYKSALKNEMKSYYYTKPENLYRQRSSNFEKKFGSNIKITYGVSDIERVEYFNEYYYLDLLESAHNLENVELESVYRVKFHVKFVGNKSEKTYNSKMSALKIDGKWYLFDLENKKLAFVSVYAPELELDGVD